MSGGDTILENKKEGFPVPPSAAGLPSYKEESPAQPSDQDEKSQEGEEEGVG